MMHDPFLDTLIVEAEAATRGKRWTEAANALKLALGRGANDAGLLYLLGSGPNSR